MKSPRGNPLLTSPPGLHSLGRLPSSLRAGAGDMGRLTAASVDFSSEAFFRDPAPVIAGLRARGALVRTRFPFVGRVWVTTTHDAAARILKDSKAFTLRNEGGAIGLRWWMPRSFAALASNMLTTDEPDHTRLRGIVDE